MLSIMCFGIAPPHFGEICLSYVPKEAVPTAEQADYYNGYVAVQAIQNGHDRLTFRNVSRALLTDTEKLVLTQLPIQPDTVQDQNGVLEVAYEGGVWTTPQEILADQMLSDKKASNVSMRFDAFDSSRARLFNSKTRYANTRAAIVMRLASKLFQWPYQTINLTTQPVYNTLIQTMIRAGDQVRQHLLQVSKPNLRKPADYQSDVFKVPLENESYQHLWRVDSDQSAALSVPS
jgi:hypothetical protein